MYRDATYSWESFPEYIALQQFSRCLSRILAAMPRDQQRRTGRILVPSAVFMAQAIAGAHADTPPNHPIDPEHREEFRQIGLESARLSRDTLLTLPSRPPDLLAALELLERVVSGLTTRPLPR